MICLVTGCRNTHAGEYPTMDDWVMHLTTIFPEIRLKKFIEMRGADGCPQEMIVALSALWVGLLYDRYAGLLSIKNLVYFLGTCGRKSRLMLLLHLQVSRLKKSIKCHRCGPEQKQDHLLPFKANSETEQPTSRMYRSYCSHHGNLNKSARLVLHISHPNGSCQALFDLL